MKEKEIVFCRLRAQGKTVSQAAEQAGYSDKYGETLSKRKEIQHEILRLLEE